MGGIGYMVFFNKKPPKLANNIFVEFFLVLFYGILNLTLAEGIMISVRSLLRSEGDVSDSIRYAYMFLSASLAESI